MRATGEFFDPHPTPPHKCPLPGWRTKDGWRCECGKAYVFEILPDRDVNPGELNWQWKRSPEHDKVVDGRRDWL